MIQVDLFPGEAVLARTWIANTCLPPRVRHVRLQPAKVSPSYLQIRSMARRPNEWGVVLDIGCWPWWRGIADGTSSIKARLVILHAELIHISFLHTTMPFDDAFISSNISFHQSWRYVSVPLISLKLQRVGTPGFRTAQANAGCICLWSCECCWNQAGRAIHSNLGEQSETLKVIFWYFLHFVFQHSIFKAMIPWPIFFKPRLFNRRGWGDFQKKRNWGSKVHLPSLCCKGVQPRSSELGISDLWENHLTYHPGIYIPWGM